MPAIYLLHEAASGYGLFEVIEAEEIAGLNERVQESVTDSQRFSKLVKLTAFQPFASAEHALDNILKVSEGILHEDLSTFLTNNLPKTKSIKKAKFYLGVSAPNIGTAIQDELEIPVKSNELVLELIRGVRMHLPKFIKQLDGGLAEKAQLGLGHSYSRSKVKFNVNRQDNMIIQCIGLLDQLDKDVNTCSMRVREWYGWHFPELSKVIPDAYIYARVVQLVGSRSNLATIDMEALSEMVLDDAVAEQIIAAGKTSMGMDVSEIDMLNISKFAERVVALARYRKQLHSYLLSKMNVVAPNLGALIGEIVAARLISHAGSLTNLAKCPASTVQILGAEKALFRALKTKTNTPKYGLIFHSSFIGRAGAKNKGRISRYLANKCAIASRIDAFSEDPSTLYGEKLKEQVEDRLAFYETGETPKKNLDVMLAVAKQIKEAEAKKSGKDTDADMEDASKSAKKAKSAKKDKKRKRDSDSDDESEAEEATEATPAKEKKEKKAKSSKKKKKSKKSKTSE
jgi:nucleolar protein 56